MSNSAGRGWPLQTWWTGKLIGFHTKRLRAEAPQKKIDGTGGAQQGHRFNFLPLKSGSPTGAMSGNCAMGRKGRFNFLPLKSGSPTALLMRDSVCKGVSTVKCHQHFLLYPCRDRRFYQKSSQISLLDTLEIVLALGRIPIIR